MFGIDNYGLFIISGILLNITPGADTAYILSRSVSGGKTDGVFSVAGITSGSLIHTILAAFGLRLMPTNDTAAITDVDTWEAYESLSRAKPL